MLKQWLTRLHFLLAPKSHHEIDEESQFHLEEQTRVNIAAGMTPLEAHRQAVISFGGVERIKEESHQQRPSYYIETVLQDIRYALRGFRRNPVFTITILVTLMLGIGATTAVCSHCRSHPLSQSSLRSRRPSGLCWHGPFARNGICAGLLLLRLAAWPKAL